MLLTARGWWVLVVASGLVLVGLLALRSITPVPSYLGLTLLAVLGWEGWQFQRRLRGAGERLRLDRELLQDGRSVPNLWVGTPTTMRLKVSNTGHQSLPFVRIVDRLPSRTTSTEPSSLDTRLAARGTATIEYSYQVDQPGRVCFEGCTVHITDLAGLFYSRQFLRVPVEYSVLPPLARHKSRQRRTKRFNALPPPGIHRLRRPGSGDELLDLREYRPGDAPKMIAWKASARRDLLITKELESDVPTRVTLLIDATHSARIGPPGQTPIIRFTDLAAAIAQATISNRDFVGMTLVEEDGVEVMAPARTKVHVLRLLHRLTAAASELPIPEAPDAETLARYAYPLAQELYPDHLTLSVNSRPLGLFWKPIADSRWRYLMFALFTVPMLYSQSWVLESLANISAIFAPTNSTWMLFAGLTLLPIVLAGLLWLFHGMRGFLPPHAKRKNRRKQLALLYTTLDHGQPIQIERYLHDDACFQRRTMEFLTTHRVALPLTIYDRTGRNQYRHLKKADYFAASLTRSMALARDTETFILFLEVLDHTETLAPLLTAIRAARARHHAVFVLLAWPVDVPRDWQPETLPVKLSQMVQEVLIRRVHAEFDVARQALTKAGAVVIVAEAKDSARLILDRLDRLQLQGGRR
ncbi:MAG: DUF58 domain-containing protein [Fimbriiglobus sp.]